MSCTRLHSVLDDVAKEFDCDDPMARSITGAFLLAVGAAAPAARAEDQDGESTSLVTVSDLSGSTNQTQTLPEATAVVRSEGTVEGETDADHPETVPSWWKPSPAGCRGSTAYPHKAHRGENMVSVHAVTECGQTVERVEVVTMVLRDRWWGLEYVMSGSSSHNNDSWSGRATPHSACRNEGDFMFRAFSVHASLEGGTVYKSTTRNWDPEISYFWC